MTLEKMEAVSGDDHFERILNHGHPLRCHECPAHIKDGAICWSVNKGEEIWCKCCGEKHLVKEAL